MTAFFPSKAVVALLVVLGFTCFGFAAVPATAAPAVATVAAAKHAPAVRDCPTRKAIVRPKGLLLACADGNELISRLKWKNWTPTKAIGTGTLSLNDCKPDCASGHFHSYKATIVLTSVRSILGVRLFTKYQLVWTANGKKHVEKGMPISY